MHHRVDPGRGGDMRRQAERQFRIEQRDIGQNDGATPRPFFSFSPVVTIEIGVTSEPVPAVVGARISGSRGPLRLADAEHIGEPFAPRREQRDKLGGVQRRAAAQSKHARGPGRHSDLDRPQDHFRGWIGDHFGEHGRLQPRRAEMFERARDDSGGHHAGIGDDENARAEAVAREFADPGERADAEMQACAGVEDERRHPLSLGA